MVLLAVEVRLSFLTFIPARENIDTDTKIAYNKVML